MGRPVKVDRRRVVDAIFYVAATGCQWRALPESYPNWNTVHRYHLEWSRDGTWERIAERLAAAVRPKEGRQAAPSAGIVDARSVRAASTVSKKTKGFDAGKKINGRKTFGIVDTLGLLMAVVVVRPASRTTSAASPWRTVPATAPLASPSCGATLGSSAPSSSTAATTTSASKWSTASIRVASRRSPTLDRRAHLGLAHEQPTPPGRLRTRSDRDRGLHLGCPQPLPPAPADPVADHVIALGKQSRQSLRTAHPTQDQNGPADADDVPREDSGNRTAGTRVDR